MLLVILTGTAIYSAGKTADTFYLHYKLLLSLEVILAIKLPNSLEMAFPLQHSEGIAGRGSFCKTIYGRTKRIKCLSQKL